MQREGSSIPALRNMQVSYAQVYLYIYYKSKYLCLKNIMKQINFCTMSVLKTYRNLPVVLRATYLENRVALTKSKQSRLTKNDNLGYKSVSKGKSYASNWLNRPFALQFEWLYGIVWLFVGCIEVEIWSFQVSHQGYLPLGVGSPVLNTGRLGRPGDRNFQH